MQSDKSDLPPDRETGRTEAMSSDAEDQQKAEQEKQKTDEEMRKAQQLADDLAPYVPKTGSLDTFWDLPKVDEALSLLDAAGYAPTDFLPSGGDLSFAGADRAAKFFKRYVRQIRAQLCTEDGKPQPTAAGVLNSGAGALVPILATALVIPALAVAVLAPIAAIIATVGLGAFCKVRNEP
jgi:hypothetical protein